MQTLVLLLAQGQEKGPYTVTQVREMLNRGVINQEALCKLEQPWQQLMPYMTRSKPNPADNKCWFLKTREEDKGPFTFGQLQSMWDSGQITADSVGRQEASWQPLSFALTSNSNPSGEAGFQASKSTGVLITQTGKQEIFGPKRTSRMAIAALVLGLLALPTAIFLLGGLLAILAIFLGHTAQAQIKRSREMLSGSGMALSGLVCAYAALGCTLLAIGIFAIPNMMKAKRASNEAQRIASSKTTASPQVEKVLKKAEGSAPGITKQVQDLKPEMIGLEKAATSLLSAYSELDVSLPWKESSMQISKLIASCDDMEKATKKYEQRLNEFLSSRSVAYNEEQMARKKTGFEMMNLLAATGKDVAAHASLYVASQSEEHKIKFLKASTEFESQLADIQKRQQSNLEKFE